MPLPKLRAGFVGFGEINTPRDIIERKCRAARARLERDVQSRLRRGAEKIRRIPPSQFDGLREWPMVQTL